MNGWDRSYPYGGIFDPTENRWEPLPPGRPESEWIAWRSITAGDDVLTTDGLLLDPVAGTWRVVPAPPGPTDRSDAALTWAGDRIVMWGGQSWQDGPGMLLGAGFTYTPEG